MWAHHRTRVCVRIGRYVVTYTAMDAAGNAVTKKRIVRVVDTTSPVVSINGKFKGTETVESKGEYVERGATSDGGETIVVTGEFVDTSETGWYTVIYTATDDTGNVGTATRVVHVVDTTAPVVTLNGASPTIVHQNTPYSEQSATADGGEEVEITGEVDTSTTGTYFISYKATDTAGNSAGKPPPHTHAHTHTHTANVVDVAAARAQINKQQKHRAQR